MNREQYIRMTEPYRLNPARAERLERTNRVLTNLIFITYPLFLLWLFLYRPGAFTRAVLVPLDGFLLVSGFRLLVNRPRPYEVFDLPPVIKKFSSGKSFPSRHVFSGVVIAVTVMQQPGFLPAGLVLLASACGIAWVRVISGVHYISDVIAGGIAGIVIGFVGFMI